MSDVTFGERMNVVIDFVPSVSLQSLIVPGRGLLAGDFIGQRSKMITIVVAIRDCNDKFIYVDMLTPKSLWRNIPVSANNDCDYFVTRIVYHRNYFVDSFVGPNPVQSSITLKPREDTGNV